MTSGLFRPGHDVRPVPRAGRLSALPLSIAVHILVVLAVVVIPLLATDTLPQLVRPLESWMPVAAPPTPPPAAAHATRRAPVLVTDTSAAPTSAPNGIARDSGLDAAPPPPEDATFQNGVIDGTVQDGRGLTPVIDAPPPPPPPARPYRPGPLIKEPIKLLDVRPIYPDVALQARIEGVVIIEAVIGPTGAVREARVLRSRPLLDEAALTAVRQWKFTPTLLNGVPVPVAITVTVNFTLR